MVYMDNVIIFWNEFELFVFRNVWSYELCNSFELGLLY